MHRVSTDVLWLQIYPYLLNMDKNDIFVTVWTKIMNVSLTEKQEKYIAAQLKSGDYQNASELVRDALRLHQLYRTRIIDELRAEISKGWEGETGLRTVKEIVSDKRRKHTS